MNKVESNRRIKFAFNLAGWNYEDGNREQLKHNAHKVIPSEYDFTMDGNLFCPGCYSNLNRIPKDKDHFSNGRDAYFSHLKTYKEVKCDLKSTKPEGKRYDTCEEAKRAIDDGSLVIVHDFIKDKLEVTTNYNSEYNETPVEDDNGPNSNVPIGRHYGESFNLPSKIMTVKGICRNFNDNLFKYYFFPGQSYAVRLTDLLNKVENVSEKNDKPKLYYGRIERTNHLGEHKRPTNIRMTYLKNEQNGVKDFCLKLTDQEQKSHGITDDSIGKIVIVYGVIADSGKGLCFENLGWGEFSLLPTKYNEFLA
jgi:hypothetical protein